MYSNRYSISLHDSVQDMMFCFSLGDEMIQIAIYFIITKNGTVIAMTYEVDVLDISGDRP